MRIRYLGIIAALTLLPSAVYAADLTPQQDDASAEPTVESQIPQSVLHSSKDNILTLVVENDMFGDGTDGNYTSGVRLSYLDISSTFPEFAHDLDDFLPQFEINDTSSLFYSVGQNIFTPNDITQSVQDPRQRPWAGFLYGSMGMVSFIENHTDQIELTLGVVGPASLAEQTQKFIHENISDSPMPKGWDNQLENEPILMLGWQRTWPQYMSVNVGPLFLSVSPYVGATVGNAYTFGDVGFNFRMGPGSEKWQDTPDRVRPAMPGSGFFEIPENDWSWYLFAGVEGRAMARNIFLDGNTFRDSYSIDKNIFVGDANAGLAVTYGQLRFAYTAVYRTREFEDQDKPEVFGTFSISRRF